MTDTAKEITILGPEKSVEEYSNSNSDIALGILAHIGAKLDKGLAATEVAECEVPENIRRMTMYYHDMLHIKRAYEEVGQPPPSFILVEVERVHDRLKYLLEEARKPGGAFHKVMEEMEATGDNRYSHLRR